ncbi:MAG: response regulator [Spirochaetales bacterium]|nr:response regulator [Spirochaetales bacterium]
MNKQTILYIADEEHIKDKLLTDLSAAVDENHTLKYLQCGESGLKACKKLLENDAEIPIVTVDTLQFKKVNIEFFQQLSTLLHQSIFILFADQKNNQGIRQLTAQMKLYRIIKKPYRIDYLRLAIQEALTSYRNQKEHNHHARELKAVKEKALQERKIIDRLSKILNEKIDELEDHQKELEQISKELNVTTIEKILIEQEAARMSKTLSDLKNNLKNNLFVRSVLHSIVNMLQIQFSIDRRENAIIKQLSKKIELLLTEMNNSNFNKLLIKKQLHDTQQLITSKLDQQRKKNELNLHKTLFGYVKAVQRTLMGEIVYFTSKPCYLLGALKKVKEKYKEILENDTARSKINFIIRLHNSDIYLKILDFSLINIIENLLTNSIRKIIENPNKNENWIKVTSYEEVIDTQEYTIIKWMDNGPGIEEQRKKTIFQGDSDKLEEGDHGIGLSDIKITIESLGGFIREEGVFGKGAVFVIGFPKVYEYEEIDYDEDFDNGVKLMFPAGAAAKKILIVEDDKVILDSYIEFFNKCGLKRVTGALDGKEALNLILAKQYIPDLLITDIEMKNMNGYTLLEQLKTQGFSISTIVISGILFNKNDSTHSDLDKLEKLGVKEVIEKPTNYKLLFELSKKHLHI